MGDDDALDALAYALKTMETPMASTWVGSADLGVMSDGGGLASLGDATLGGITVAPYFKGATVIDEPEGWSSGESMSAYLARLAGAESYTIKGWYSVTIQGRCPRGAPLSQALYIDQVGMAPNIDLGQYFTQVHRVIAMNGVSLPRVAHELRMQIAPVPNRAAPPQPEGLYDGKTTLYDRKPMRRVNRVTLIGYDHNGHLQMKTLPGDPMPVSPDLWVRVTRVVDAETDDELPWLEDALNGALKKRRLSTGKMTEADIEDAADGLVASKITMEGIARQKRLEMKHHRLSLEDEADGVALRAISHADAVREMRMGSRCMEAALARTSVFADNPRDVLRGRTLTAMESHIADDQTRSPAYGGVLNDLTWKE